MKLGRAFSDSLVIEQKKEFRHTRDTGDSWWLGAGRALIFATILCVSFFVLTWRLFDLTLIRGHEFRALADGNRTRELIRHAPRGLLLDRTGKPLVANIPQYRLLRPCETNTNQDCTVTISREEGDRLSKEGLPPGHFLEVDYRREYLYPESTSHVTGYIGELTEKELEDEYYQLRYYRRGDRVGRTGAEAYYEEKLRGRDGKELVEVDAGGKIFRVLGRAEEIPGENVTLSIDATIAEVAAKSYPVGEKGAVVVTKPSTGEVLALFSSPTFSANKFSLGMSQAEYEQLLNDPERPLFNRAIGGVYPPASTFKLVTSLAGIEEGIVKKDTTVTDDGTIKIGSFSFANWYFTQYGKTEGVIDIVRALKRSNDIFFYKLGEWIGITKIAKWAHIVGIGKPLGIELSGEATGLMPDPAWKAAQFNTQADQEARNGDWYLGDTYHVSIGQGYLLTTPLQVNAWTNVIANGGSLCRPTIEKVVGGRGKSASCNDLNIKKESLRLITEGMKESCSAGGTGWPLFNFSVNASANQRINEKNEESSSSAEALKHGRNDTIRIPVACKTGTAEFGHPKNHTHAWFTVFAPLRQDFVGQAPLSENEVITGEAEISISVLVEGAGEGSDVAAPVAKKILEEWFGR